MKIQKVSADNQAKVYALLRQAFPGSDYEAALVEKFHQNKRPIHEWVCLHRNKVISYIAFSNAFHGNLLCGLHLAPMAVRPDMQKQGVGTELLNFALRQAEIKSQSLFVLGKPAYYKKFGFELCQQPVCPFDKNNANFLSLRNPEKHSFTVGYEAEFTAASMVSSKPAATGNGKSANQGGRNQNRRRR